MKSGIDLKPFSTGSKYRGIGMYSSELIREFLKTDHEFYFLNLYEKYDGTPDLTGDSHLYQYHTGPKIVDSGERQLCHDPRTKEIIKAAVGNFIENTSIDVMLFTSPTEYANLYEADWFGPVFKAAILYDLIPLIFPDQCLFDSTYKEDYE